MKIWIDADERYPDYIIKNEPIYSWSKEGSVEVPDDLVSRFLKVQEEYNKLSEELGDYYDRHNKM